MPASITTSTTAPRASSRYTTGKPNQAMMKPPIAGPAIVEISNMLEFQVTALLSAVGGSSRGMIEARAGQPRMRRTAMASRSA